MKNTKIIVKTKSKIYPIYFGNKNLNLIGTLVKKNLPNVKKICVLYDNNLPKTVLTKLSKSLKKYKIKIYKLYAHEKTKSITVANKLVEKLLNDNFNRSDCVIALGGGIVTDLSAFVASITKRGIKLINIPTTLLAQVDASIGGKTAVNSVQGKNLIGTFYQPDFVLIDISLLSSLPKREMVCGYAEILKHSLISDKKFFLWLSKNAKKIVHNKNKNFLKLAIIKSCKIKSKIINKDEKEKNLRMILNFGHTFAHGFEGAKNFSKELNHGEAVLLGMVLASQLSYNKKLLSKKELDLIKSHYINLDLPMKLKSKFKKTEMKKIVFFAKKDKKNLDGKIKLVLLNKIGKTSIAEISDTKFKEFLDKNYI
tara:strand:- start:1034 stop:2137 length:1104 start_codon:yes stop_codon:yes gene_type:complete